MSYLSLNLPGDQTITAPRGIPTGGFETASKIFSNTFVIMIIICIMLSLIFIVLSGIQWIRSGGDKNKLQAARQRLTWAIGGLIVALLAFFIVGLIGYFFKVDLLAFPSR